MSSLPEKLADLNRRLQSITQLPNDQDNSQKVENVEIDLTKSKYVCAECAWTISINAAALARHFTLKHVFRLKCPDCKTLCENHEGLEKHQSQKHGYPVNEGKHHEPCESQHRVPATIGNEVTSPTTGGPTISWKASASVQSILNRKSSVQSGSCPDPECQLTFPDFNALYEHYAASHPLYIIYSGHPKPFKCPFCPKRYQHGRFVAGHVRTHKPKSLGTEDVQDQETLIRQSHIAMAHRRSLSYPEAQLQSDRASSDEEVGCSVPVIQEEGYRLIIKDDVIYLDEGVEPQSPIPERSNQTNVQESRRLQGATRVGLRLQASPADSFNPRPENEKMSVEVAFQTHTLEPKLSESMDLDDGYPERFAFTKDSFASKMSTTDSRILAVQLPTKIFPQGLSREIIRALQMEHHITVSEVADLFHYFLDDDHRMYVLNEIGSINPNLANRSILATLHGTTFKAVLDSWIDFKRRAIRYAPQLVRQAHNQGVGLSKSITWALLQYCLNLETMIYRNKFNIAHRFLRNQPLDNLVLATNAPFPHLIAALTERVKNKINHDASIVFTDEMGLSGTRDYMELLQMEFRPLYPIAAGHEKLWRELRLL